MNIPGGLTFGAAPGNAELQSLPTAVRLAVGPVRRVTMYAGRFTAFGALPLRAAARPMTAFLSQAEIQTEALLDHATNLALRQSVV